MGTARLGPWTVIVQLVSLAVAVVLGLVLVAKRVGADAPRVPSGGSTAPVVEDDAGIDGGKPPEDQMEDAVTRADGGVPIHEKGEFRSPFANPRWGKVTDVRVGIVLNDLTNYDIHTGSFVADFYLSLTSEKEMPSMDMMFPNGKPDERNVISD